MQQVVWSVSSVLSTPTPQHPFPLSNVNINIGNAWNSTTYAANIQQSGLYYVYIHVGLNMGSNTVQLWIVLNGDRKLSAQFMSTPTIVGTMRGTGALMTLQPGDTLTVELANTPSMNMYAAANAPTVFYGMLLSPYI
jgi:hypothetical protein